MFSKLINHGILGINARNLLYIKPHNPKKAVRFADDKIATKFFFEARGIQVPKLLYRISNKEELSNFDWNKLPNSFVLKPNTGYGGEGIIVITGKKNENFIDINGNTFTNEDLFDHVESIIAGKFSITYSYDTAFFEQRILSHEILSHFTNTGLPDIRIVIYNLIPIMAMIRIPTEESEGKANVHLGAIGVGIDIAKGTTTHAVQHNNIIDKLPQAENIKGIKIPFWDEILLMASKIQQISNLGFIACDITIDKNQGPILLEINARTGLMLQIANLSPLRTRLERVEGLKVTTPAKGVRIGQELFGQKIEETIKNISGKEVIGNKESIELFLPQGRAKTLIAKIDPNSPKSKISQELVQSITEGERESRKSIKIKCALGSKKMQTMVDIEDLSDCDYQMIIGLRDLSDFLIDPQKKFHPYSAPSKFKINFHSIDKRLCDIDNKIKLIYALTPLNLEEEKRKFLINPSYNPVFVYPELDFDTFDLLDRLKYIETDNSALGEIFKKKKKEIENKILLLQSIGNHNKFTEISLRLFPKPGLRFVRLAKQIMNENKDLDLEEENIDAEQAKENIEEVFKKYNLHDWKVVLKDNMISNCSVNKNKALFLNQKIIFSPEYIKRLICHEIETHIFTTENAFLQTYQIFKQGTANYLYTQEGLAKYNELHFLPQTKKHNGIIGIGLLASYFALENSFAGTYKKLINLGITKKDALKSTLKAKRGLKYTSLPGAFTKDNVYLVGYEMIKKYLEKDNGDLKKLYIGKINLEDLDLIEKIKEITPPKYIPEFLK